MLASNWKNAEYNRRMGKKNIMATTILNRWRSAGFEDGTRTKRGPSGYATSRHDISCGRRKSQSYVISKVDDILLWFGRHWHLERWPEAGKGRPCWLTPVKSSQNAFLGFLCADIWGNKQKETIPTVTWHAGHGVTLRHSCVTQGLFYLFFYYFEMSRFTCNKVIRPTSLQICRWVA